jgi:hypothetical protein
MWRCWLVVVVASFSRALDLNQWAALQDLFEQLRCNGTNKCPTLSQTAACPTTRRSELNCDADDVRLISFTGMTGEISTKIGFVANA